MEIDLKKEMIKLLDWLDYNTSGKNNTETVNNYFNNTDNKALNMCIVSRCETTDTKDFSRLKNLSDLKAEYPKAKKHRISFFGGYINYIVDGEIVHKTKVL